MFFMLYFMFYFHTDVSKKFSNICDSFKIVSYKEKYTTLIIYIFKKIKFSYYLNEKTIIAI